MLAIGFGLLQAWSHRFTMSIDGVSYVDIAANLAQHDWKHAVTGHWSPLFPAALALAMAVVRPAPYEEFPLVHAVELLLYIAALAAFTFLLAELVLRRDRDAEESERAVLPRDLLLVFGYVTFLWTTLVLITLHGVTPDLLVAGLLYLAAALLVRIRRGAAGVRTWLLLGIVLGLGYLAKTILLLVAPAFLAAAWLAAPDRRAAGRRLALAAGVWLAIAVPWIGVLSEGRGRWTIGDAGRDTYAWEVGHIPYPHWRGGPPGFGEPIHPPRLIHASPPVYEFGAPVDGTYPLWYDPSYWYDGIRIPFSLYDQLLAIFRSLLIYLPVVDILLLSWFILFVVSVRGRPDLFRPFTASAFLLLPAATGLFLYTLVHVQERYVAGFLTLAFLALMLGVRLPRSDLSPRVYRAGVLAAGLVLMADLCLSAAADLRRVLEPPGDWRRSVAGELHRMGVEPGDRVAWIGGNFDPSWARLARVQIVAEIRIEESTHFWDAEQEVRDEILERLESAGAEAVYASAVPGWAPSAGWTVLGEGRYARRLRP